MSTKNSRSTAPTARELRPIQENEREAYRRPSKISETISAAIVEDIVSRGLKKGDRLPSEAEMLVQYRVSRSSLREALRLLEVHGLIVIRPGAGAGTVVGQATSGNFARILSLFLHFSGSTYDEILESWVITEGVLTRLAAQNRDRETVHKLMAPFLAGQPEHAKHDVEEGLGFHYSIAVLAGNPTLTLLFRSVSQLVNDQVLKAHSSREMVRQSVVDHHDIAQAIIDGEPRSAEDRMIKHARRVIDEFRALWPQNLGETVEWR